MTKLMLTTIGVAALVILVGYDSPAAAQNHNNSGNRQYRNGSTDPRQHGYEHGYRDGADRGRQDRERGLPRTFRDYDYLEGARDYAPSFGSRREFMAGYRDGYRTGYDDGYYDRDGRYWQLYGSLSRGETERYGDRSRWSPDMAFDAGYREGIAAGQQDQQRNIRSDFRRSDAYRHGDANFQDGFERGYQDGYGRSRYEYDGGGYFPNRGGTGAADTRDGEGIQSRTIPVPGTRLWTPTTIRVRQGDRLQIQASGEIRFTSNPSDVAHAAGALNQKYLAGAPLPGALAGALIGRIDSGQPFGIGDQTAIVAPASGLLYLGINDDNVADNTGQFQVTISW